MKRGEAYPTHLAKADLRECFLRRCQVRFSKIDRQTVDGACIGARSLQLCMFMAAP